ncbi:MAG: response regulator transcription factor [Phenylobacterium sp.]|uniref:helix-turn-helix transcriptional regulator n=1 Tax=Phenylobacterium sp. TaxID=1871053 RepID=UPI001A38B41D|nr:LuxR C-terminal-related transcriptional regulator [Phenylobacterium sp.]MBL8773220.1 response regulator transcription factor [Phenylobacterium sp.]
MVRFAAPYAIALAAGAFLLQWLEYRQLSHGLALEAYIAILALAFSAGGAWLGWRLAARRRGPGFVRNEAALASLRLTRQELRVLEILATGQSNKEIGRTLGLSPNTVKTHLANACAKLGVSRRTEAVGRARELDLIP